MTKNDAKKSIEALGAEAALLAEKYRDLQEEMQAEVYDRSERWQMGDKGDEWQDVMDSLEDQEQGRQAGGAGAQGPRRGARLSEVGEIVSARGGARAKTRAMEREAEILDTAGGNCFKTGEGAIFQGEEECERELEKLRRLDAGEAARFIVDWHGEDGDLLETFGLDEAGFEALTGNPPKPPKEYAAYDAAYWESARAARRALLPCPFCGGPAEIQPWHGGKLTKKMVSCAEPCDVGPQATGETRKEAIRKWNTRATAMRE